MKKILIGLFIIIIGVATATAGNLFAIPQQDNGVIAKRQSVLGLSFGANYYDVRESVLRRYDRELIREENGIIKILMFQDGDFYFDYAGLEFHNQKFNHAKLINIYPSDDLQTAIFDINSLVKKLREKYPRYIKKGENVEGYTFYVGGTFVVCRLWLQRIAGTDDSSKIFLFLEYGPFNI